MARNNCRHVFPDYETRFKYPGKIGQMRLFQKSGTAHPHAETYRSLDDFRQQYGDDPKNIAFELPCVFKFDWGGEGEAVFLINTRQDFRTVLQKAADFERSGQKGFLLQEYVPAEGRTLRVAVIGRTLISYWRIQEKADGFLSSVSRGARIDAVLEPQRQNVAKVFVKNLCKKTGINLAGFDVIFAPVKEYIKPLMLEINYFFGRRGLGGSDAFYEILKREVHNWLETVLSAPDK
jgi:ribosomal protein S6--L-glutamate ligase